MNMTKSTPSTRTSLISRKRRRAFAMGVFLVAAMTPAARTFSPHVTVSPRPTGALFVAKRPEYAQQRSDKRLSRREETELLQKAAEMRRLTTLERDMALASPGKSMPLVSVRAKQAGYGDDLDAYERAMEDGYQAREALVTKNMGLVHYCIQDIIGSKRGRLNSLSREDLIQEGAIGLARAVDKWNPEVGGKFSTYAVYWVRAAILRGIAQRDDMVRVPENVSIAASRITKAAKRLGIQIDADGALSPIYAASSNDNWKQARLAKSLAEEAGLTSKQLEEAIHVRKRRFQGGYVSFEDWMQKGQDLQHDVVTSTVTAPTSVEDREHIRTILSKFLRPREMEALSWRYGLNPSDAKPRKARNYVQEAEATLFGSSPQPTELTQRGRWGEAMSFNEVGKQMQVSAEYGRRLCKSALDKLKAAADDGRLEPALLS